MNRATRGTHGLRELALRRRVNRHAEGSALVEWGDTHVLATVTVDPRLPPHLRGRGRGSGWLTAEYAMLPRATRERKQRERPHVGGRTHEIQRLVGRALRAGFDLAAFPTSTLVVDVDVLQADGGTRCAAVLAGYAALHDLADAAIFDGRLTEWPLRHEVGAVSVGLVDGEILVDLDYEEDVRAEADLAVVATAEGAVIEVQGGTEGEALDAERYVQLVAAGVTAVGRLLERARGLLR
jgi:ribonuclease PH